MKKYRWERIAKISAALLVAFALHANGASFDCAKASSNVEKLICSDADLSDIDSDLGRVYATAQVKNPGGALLKGQRAWLKTRNQCADVECLKSRYRERLSVLAGFKMGGWISAINDEPPAPPRPQLCQKLLNRLNEYTWSNDKEVDECYRNVVVTSSDFSEPPWQEMNAREHIDLLARLLRYAQISSRYFDDVANQDAAHGPAETFIAQGGRMLLWRHRIFESYGRKKAPDGEQSVVQLRYQVDAFESTKKCPDKPAIEWRSSYFIVTDDLAGPDPNVSVGPFTMMVTGSLVLNDGFAYFVEPNGAFGNYYIFQSNSFVGAAFCAFKHASEIE